MCPCQPVACRNVGCNMSVPPNAIAQHQEEECPFRLVVCNWCNSSVKVADHVVSYNIKIIMWEHTVHAEHHTHVK